MPSSDRTPFVGPIRPHSLWQPCEWERCHRFVHAGDRRTCFQKRCHTIRSRLPRFSIHYDEASNDVHKGLVVERTEMPPRGMRRRQGEPGGKECGDRGWRGIYSRVQRSARAVLMRHRRRATTRGPATSVAGSATNKRDVCPSIRAIDTGRRAHRCQRRRQRGSNTGLARGYTCGSRRVVIKVIGAHHVHGSAVDRRGRTVVGGSDGTRVSVSIRMKQADQCTHSTAFGITCTCFDTNESLKDTSGKKVSV